MVVALDLEQFEVERIRQVQAFWQRLVPRAADVADAAARDVEYLPTVVKIVGSGGDGALLCSALEQLREEGVARRRGQEGVVDGDRGGDADGNGG